jgi:glycosyltransferase involved in cell wall biosynthesis
MRKAIWIINPYGTLPGESWATYRSTMLADALAADGFSVTQFISNFEHRSKTFRCADYKEMKIANGYSVRIIPSTAYRSHISVQRIRYERRFARNVIKTLKGEERPAIIVLAEPALFYYDILLKHLILRSSSKLVIDLIDTWPELFQIAVPRRWRSVASVLMAPLYKWRRRLYQHADAIVAVAHNYMDLARTLTNRKIPMEVVYWSYPSQETDTGDCNNEKINELIARKESDEVWAIYAGTLGENYDIPSIIRVADELTTKLAGSAKFKIIVAGDGPLRKLCEQVHNENFKFLGRLPVKDLKTLYQSCDLALCTYQGESTVAMPIKAFDYLLFGLPMVNSLRKDLGTLIQNYEVGLNYDAHSPSSMYQAVSTLILNTALRRRYSKNAKIAAKEFTSDTQYKKFVDLIRSLL